MLVKDQYLDCLDWPSLTKQLYIICSWIKIWNLGGSWFEDVKQIHMEVQVDFKQVGEQVQVEACTQSVLKGLKDKKTVTEGKWLTWWINI